VKELTEPDKKSRVLRLKRKDEAQGPAAFYPKTEKSLCRDEAEGGTFSLSFEFGISKKGKS